MNMLMKLKKNKKGFTLVELLVVLVILAILAAAIIPSMMGFIDKAKNESVAAECRNVELAARVVLDEDYGKDLTSAADYDIDESKIITIGGLAAGSVISVDTAKTATGDHFYISAAKYNASNGYVYDYAANTDPTKAGTWTKGAKVSVAP